MENPIESRKRMVQDRIEKSFQDGLNLNDEIEKGRHGIYEDNAENRKKNRVGQEYGHAAQQKEPTGRPAGSNAGEQPSVEDHASNASDKALQRAVADNNAPSGVRQAAKKELEKRGGQEKTAEDKTETKVEEQPKTEENTDSDFTEEDAKRFEELDSYIDDPKEKYSDKWYNALREYKDLRERSFNHELKKDGLLNLDDFKDVKGIGTIHVSKTNDSGGNQIQTPYISITIDKKKDLKNFIKDVNSKLGIELSDDNFEFHPRDRYSGSYYEIAVNPKTKEFNTDSEIRKQIKDEHANKQREEAEAKRLAQKKQTMNSLKGSNSLTKESVNKLLEDDETKGHAFSYFNYGDDEDCTPEEIEQFEKLKKMGAKTSDYFDWKESDEAETYEKKMQAKGYRLFDISTADGYLWLMIKDKKLSKDVEKSIINDIDIADVDEAKEILKGIDAENEFFEKAVYADTPENRKLGRVGQEYHKKSRGEKKAEYKKEFKRVSGVADYIAEVAGSSKSKQDKKKIARKIMKVKQDKSLTMEEKRKKILALNKMLAKSEE